jgi:ferredoxin
MAWKIDRGVCLRCGACVSVCPVLALELQESGVAHDAGKCTLCTACEKICPVGSIRVEK